MNTLQRTLGLVVLVVASVAPAGRLAAQQPATQHPAAAAKREVPAALLAKAKITEDSARALAPARVPHPPLTEGELGGEHGSLVWSFGLVVAGEPGIEECTVA